MDFEEGGGPVEGKGLVVKRTKIMTNGLGRRTSGTGGGQAEAKELVVKKTEITTKGLGWWTSGEGGWASRGQGASHKEGRGKWLKGLVGGCRGRGWTSRGQGASRKEGRNYN